MAITILLIFCLILGILIYRRSKRMLLEEKKEEEDEQWRMQIQLSWDDNSIKPSKILIAFYLFL